MKVIDIANKIENNEIQLPIKFQIKDLKHRIYNHIAFYESKKAYWFQNNSSCIVTFDDLFREIEIIEEDKEIEEISEEDIQSHYFTGADEIMARKINELIKEVNKIKKEGK